MDAAATDNCNEDDELDAVAAAADDGSDDADDDNADDNNADDLHAASAADDDNEDDDFDAVDAAAAVTDLFNEVMDLGVRVICMPHLKVSMTYLLIIISNTILTTFLFYSNWIPCYRIPMELVN